MGGVETDYEISAEVEREIANSFEGCRRCGAPVFVAVTAARGKRIPFNVTPVAGGRFTLRIDAETREVAGIALVASYIDAHDLALYQQRHGEDPVAFMAHLACLDRRRRRG